MSDETAPQRVAANDINIACPHSPALQITVEQADHQPPRLVHCQTLMMRRRWMDHCDCECTYIQLGTQGNCPFEKNGQMIGYGFKINGKTKTEKEGE